MQSSFVGITRKSSTGLASKLKSASFGSVHLNSIEEHIYNQEIKKMKIKGIKLSPEVRGLE